MSSDSDDNKPEPSTKRKRGVRRTSEYKSEVIKRARLQGAAYTNWKGRNVPPVVVALDSKCGCNRNCCEFIPDADKERLLREFRNLRTKNEQDCYLQQIK